MERQIENLFFQLLFTVSFLPWTKMKIQKFLGSEERIGDAGETPSEELII